MSQRFVRTIPDIQNLVIKIGSNIISDKKNGVNEKGIAAIADTVAKIRKKIPYVTIVSSGAVASGFRLLGFKTRPTALTDKQACASLGQARLMWYYEGALSNYGLHAAQILITKHDFSSRTRYLNARSTINRLLELGAIPIINENDTVVVNELKYIESFGDNDNLSALVAGLIDADLLLILSDVDGLYTADPIKNKEASLIYDVQDLGKDIFKFAGDSSSSVGTGGMATKLSAAQKALRSGTFVAIINGTRPDNIMDFLDGKKVGTFFSKPNSRSQRKKLWLAYATIPQGTLVVDDGAAKALLERHSSLLSTGITEVKGVFKAGDVVSVENLSGVRLGVGKVRYSSIDLAPIIRKRSVEINIKQGKNSSGIVIHCDDMAFE